MQKPGAGGWPERHPFVRPDGESRAPIGLERSVCFSVPDRVLWERGYPAEAGRSLLPVARTLDDALAIVTPFLDPLLDGSATGAWDPEHRRWTT